MGLFDGLFGGLGAIASTAMSYKNNKKLMEKQQQWTEKMDNTKLQRGIKDAKQAGINPILVAGNGQTAPSSGLNSTQVPNLGEAFNTAKANQIAEKQADSQVELQQAQSQLAQEQSLTESTQQRINIAKAIEQEGLNNFLDQRQRAELKKLGSEIINLDVNSAWMKAKQNAIASEIDLNSAQAMLHREATKTQSKANKYDEKHPIQYGTSRLFSGIGNVFSIRR